MDVDSCHFENNSPTENVENNNIVEAMPFLTKSELPSEALKCGNEFEIVQESVIKPDILYNQEKCEPVGNPEATELSNYMIPDVCLSPENDVTSIEAVASADNDAKKDAANVLKQPSEVKGSVRLVRLQAATTVSGNVSFSDAAVSKELSDSMHAGQTIISTVPESLSRSASTPKTPIWIPNSGSSSSSGICTSSGSSLPSPADEMLELSNSGESVSSHCLQRLLTSDGQIVYGYKDINGEVQYFYSAGNDRESHNEKERKRRSRVSEACSDLRKLVPGLSEKTDKATVFEQAARYLHFLREKFGAQFDQSYCEKYFHRRCEI